MILKSDEQSPLYQYYMRPAVVHDRDDSEIICNNRDIARLFAGIIDKYFKGYESHSALDARLLWHITRRQILKPSAVLLLPFFQF